MNKTLQAQSPALNDCGLSVLQQLCSFFSNGAPLLGAKELCVMSSASKTLNEMVKAEAAYRLSSAAENLPEEIKNLAFPLSSATHVGSLTEWQFNANVTSYLVWPEKFRSYDE